MSIAKYTPGPWVFYTESVDPNWHIVTPASRMRVLANVHIEPGNELDLANARLIAAAPCLLEAAQAFLRLCEQSGWTITADSPAGRARAAIAKATGGGA